VPAYQTYFNGEDNRMKIGEENKVRTYEERYSYSTNLTVKELQDMLAYAKTNKINVIGAHFTNDCIKNSIHVSGSGGCPIDWDDVDDHTDVSDYASA